jgi:hypothetical protein
MADYKALNAAAKKAASITGGSLDYLIVNGALVTEVHKSTNQQSSSGEKSSLERKWSRV